MYASTLAYSKKNKKALGELKHRRYCHNKRWQKGAIAILDVKD